MDLHALEALLYYCCLINGGLLLVSAGLLMGFQDTLLALHSRLLGVPPARLRVLYVQWLAAYKILFLLFNLSPYLALRLMS